MVKIPSIFFFAIIIYFSCSSLVSPENLSEKKVTFSDTVNKYKAIVDIPWDTSDALSLPGQVLTFHKDFTFDIQEEPCGDVTCPSEYNGKCEYNDGLEYICKIVEHCYGELIDADTVNRKCDEMQSEYFLEINTDKPVVRRWSKRKILTNLKKPYRDACERLIKV